MGPSPLRTVLVWLALNAGLALIIAFLYYVWKSTRPLTGARLATRLARETTADADRPDLSLGELAVLLRDTGRGRELHLFAAALTELAEKGAILCEITPKKRLVSFGDDLQPTLSFPETRPLEGAAGALCELLRAAASEETLQLSEGYNWVRANAVRVDGVLARYEAEGRAFLRANGALRNETHRFLFTSQERLIFTPRGERRAVAARRWENHLREQPSDSASHAVLLGLMPPPSPLDRLCESFEQALNAGRASGKH